MFNKKVVWGLVLVVFYSQFAFGVDKKLLNTTVNIFAKLITEEVIVPESLIEKSLDFLSGTEDKDLIDKYECSDDVFRIEEAHPNSKGQYAWYEHRVYKDFASKCQVIYQRAKEQADKRAQVAACLLFGRMPKFKLVSLFGENVTTSQQLWVADDLKGEAKLLDIGAVNKKFGFTYCEGLVYAENERQQAADNKYKFKLIQRDKKYEIIREKISERLKDPITHKLEIRFINNEVGYGVFAREDIKAGTVIGIYAGESWIGHREYPNIGRNDDKEYMMTDTLSSDEDEWVFTNAHHIGGITRFIQHMPNDDEVPEALQGGDSLATANIAYAPIAFCNFGLDYFIAKCDIKKGEQLGCSYGWVYWVGIKAEKNKSVRYFHKDGRVMEL